MPTNSGIWTDVAAKVQSVGYWQVIADGSQVSITDGATVLGPWPGRTLYNRVISDLSDAPSSIGQDWATGQVRINENLLAGTKTNGQQCVAIGRTQTGAVVAFWCDSATTYMRLILGGTPTQYPNAACPGTSQGWLDVFPDDDPAKDVFVWTDLTPPVTQAGVTMGKPTTRGGLTVGQPPGGFSGPPQVTGCLNGTTPTSFFAGQVCAVFPHVAQLTDGSYAVTTSLNGGIVSLTTAPPFPAYQGAAAPPVDPPAATPPTDPPITVTLPSYGKPGDCGCFFDTDERDGDYIAPGNTEIIVNGTVLAGNQQVSRPVWTSPDCAFNVTLTQLRGIVNAADATTPEGRLALDAETAMATRYQIEMGRPLGVAQLLDGAAVTAAWLAAQFVPGRSRILTLECYPTGPNDTGAAIAARHEADIQTALAFDPAMTVIPIWPADSHTNPGSGAEFWPLQVMLDAYPLLDALTRKYLANMGGTFWFAWGRPDGGARLHPDIQAWIAANAAAWGSQLPGA